MPIRLMERNLSQSESDNVELDEIEEPDNLVGLNETVGRMTLLEK